MVFLETISSLATLPVFRTRVDETNGYLTAGDVQYFLAWARQRIGQLSESKVGITTGIYHASKHINPCDRDSKSYQPRISTGRHPQNRPRPQSSISRRADPSVNHRKRGRCRPSPRLPRFPNLALNHVSSRNDRYNHDDETKRARTISGFSSANDHIERRRTAMRSPRERSILSRRPVV